MKPPGKQHYYLRKQVGMRTGNLKLLVPRFVIGGILATVAVHSPVVPAANDEPQQPSLPPAAQNEIVDVESRIDRYEASYLKEFQAVPPAQNYQATNEIMLGALLLYDKTLSVKRNEACAFCHMPETGFTGPVSTLNETTGSYPGSVRSRFGDRKPPSYSYATAAPVLHYDTTQSNFYGGNFWDGNATGTRLGNPSAEQAQGPPTNPSKGASPTSPVSSTAPPAHPIAASPKPSGALRSLPSTGPQTQKPPAPNPADTTTPPTPPFISAPLIAATRRPPTINSPSPSPSTKRILPSIASAQSSTSTSPATSAPSYHTTSCADGSSSAPRETATPAISTEPRTMAPPPGPYPPSPPSPRSMAPIPSPPILNPSLPTTPSPILGFPATQPSLSSPRAGPIAMASPRTPPAATIMTPASEPSSKALPTLTKPGLNTPTTSTAPCRRPPSATSISAPASRRMPSSRPTCTTATSRTSKT